MNSNGLAIEARMLSSGQFCVSTWAEQNTGHLRQRPWTWDWTRAVSTCFLSGPGFSVSSFSVLSILEVKSHSVNNFQVPTNLTSSEPPLWQSECSMEIILSKECSCLPLPHTPCCLCRVGTVVLSCLNEWDVISKRQYTGRSRGGPRLWMVIGAFL